MATIVLLLAACTAEQSSPGPGTAAPSPYSQPASSPAESSPSPDNRTGSDRSVKRIQKRALKVIGHHPLGGDGYNADVFSLGDFAYVGDFGHDPATGIPCPSDGVKAIDISNPSEPKLAAVLHNPANTSAEDIVVRKVRTKEFEGDLAVTGLQACNKELAAPRGLLFFDVSNPYKPKELGSWEAPAGTRGCHEIDLAVRPGAGKSDRVVAACANPNAAAGAGVDEVALVDATNPRSPEQVGGFTLATSPGFGCLPLSFAHSVRFFDDARRLYVSYWDAGTVLLDVDNPASPTQMEVTSLREHSSDGDNHSMTLASDGRLLLINSEDISPFPEVFIKDLHCQSTPGDEWGQLSIFDNSNESKPRFIASFGTANSKQRTADGVYTVHNTEVVGQDQAFSSWYSDGVRWIDLSRPSKPREVAHFLPPRMKDPRGNLPSSPFVWGVWPNAENGVILVSDINSGLWILEPVGLQGS